MISRRQKELTDSDIQDIAEIYHNWRDKNWEKKYKDIPGLCKAVKIDEVRKNKYILTPGRYIEFKVADDNVEEFDARMKELSERLSSQLKIAMSMDKEIKKSLNKIGYEIIL